MVLSSGILVLIQVAATFPFIALFTLWAVYAERKVSAWIQDRIGPMEVGPHGAFQTAADILKLILKESIIPAAAQPLLFIAAPIVIFVSVFAGYAALPVGPDIIASSFSVGVLYIIAIIAVDVIGLLSAGWGSSNKYALLGSVRAVAQMISYEIPTALIIIATVMMTGSLNLQVIALRQGIFSDVPVHLWGMMDITHVGGFLSWNIVRYPHLIPAFIIFFISTLAECNRAPFDLPEAESELVSGFHVEYSGYRFAVIFLAEYAKMLLVCLIGAILFFGGWNTPLPNIGSLSLAEWTSGTGTIAATLWGVCWLLLKGVLLILLQMWVRWTYPRLRMDQLTTLCWKYLIPGSILIFFLSGIIRLWEVGGL